MKIILVGNSGVGKSSILYYYENKMKYYNNILTIGVEKYETTIKVVNKDNTNSDIKIHIWDTAGQETYNSIVSLYYKHSVGAVLVFDITNSKSFNDLTKWINNITLNNKDIKKEHIILIGNKSDLLEDRKIKYNDAYKFMLKNNLGGYIETSAFTGYNINFIFSKLSQEIYNSYPDMFVNNKYYVNNKNNDKKYINCCNIN
jgi:small GTP-binding protein